MPRLNTNSIALAGEFATLTQLFLRGFDANVTLGRTKSVDILVSDPNTEKMLRIEVKTHLGRSRSIGGNPAEFGNYLCSWRMNKKHEGICKKNLFYCFVHISEDQKQFRFFVLPSPVVADYVKKQHELYLRNNQRRSRRNDMRTFRIGRSDEKYPIPTPTAEKYEDNWKFEVT